MAGYSDYAENKILDHVFGGPDYTRPATLYLALLTAAPTDSDTGSTIVEANYTGYSRKAVTNDATNFPAASSGAKSNGVELLYSECTAGSSTITHFAWVDAASAGNVIGYGALTLSKIITAGDTPRFPVGTLTIAQD